MTLADQIRHNVNYAKDFAAARRIAAEFESMAQADRAEYLNEYLAACERADVAYANGYISWAQWQVMLHDAKRRWRFDSNLPF